MFRRVRPVLSLLVLLLFCGCELGGERPLRIRYWNGFTGPDGRTMLRMIQRFNRENPDVEVTMQRIAWDIYYNKLFVAGVGGRAPDVFVVHTDALTRFYQAGFIENIDPLLEADPELSPGMFDEKILDSVRYDGRLYALPLDIHTFGLYYNKRMLREAGFVDEAGQVLPPTNREEFLEVARATTRDADGDGRPEEWGFVFTWFRNVLYSLLAQWEAPVFNDAATRCVVDNPLTREPLGFLADLIQKEKVAPSPENFDGWIGFRQGRVAMAFEGIWMLSDLEKQEDLEWGAAPLPRIGPTPGTFAGGHNLCLRAGLEGPRREAAWRFLKFLSDNSLDWAEGGQIPARRELRETERFRAMGPQSRFATQIPHARYGPRVPFVFEFYTEFDIAVERVLRGSMSPAEALAEAERKINEDLERQLDQLERARREEAAQ